MAKQKVSAAIKVLQNQLDCKQEAAKKIYTNNSYSTFQKNLDDALKTLAKERRYTAFYIDTLYDEDTRWYRGVLRSKSKNIKIQTLFKLATAFEMTPGELIDYVLGFGKNGQKK